jgi:hypothetical protein
MSHRPAIHRRPFLGALQQLFGHPGGAYDRFYAADAEPAMGSSAVPEGASPDVRELAEHLARLVRTRGAAPIGEVIALARRVVDLHDRFFGEECEDRRSFFSRSWQQLHAAVLILCSDSRPIEQRLADAWAVLGSIDDRDLPAIVRPRACALQAELAQMARREDGFGNLSREEAEQAAARLLLLYVHTLGAALAARPGATTGANTWVR